jgi:ABC-2 type transport system ATP-binding protein/lipopolysaccharide transport system ATP-binding protein
MVRPEILLVDEVIAVGDEEFQRKCYDYLYDLRRSGTSMIVVSHGLSQINDLCDEALWLSDGEPQMLGSARRVTRAYLDAVNAREAARDAASGQGSTVGRRGTGLIRVTGVEVADANGTAGGVVLTGSSVFIKLAYEAKVLVPDAVFGFTIDNAEGMTMVGSNSGQVGAWSVEGGPGQVECRVERCLLAPGAYTLRTIVVAEGSVLDADDVGIPFVVRNGPQEVGGLFWQPADWSRIPGAAGSGTRLPSSARS